MSHSRPRGTEHIPDRIVDQPGRRIHKRHRIARMHVAGRNLRGLHYRHPASRADGQVQADYRAGQTVGDEILRLGSFIKQGRIPRSLDRRAGDIAHLIAVLIDHDNRTGCGAAAGAVWRRKITDQYVPSAQDVECRGQTRRDCALEVKRRARRCYLRYHVDDRCSAALQIARGVKICHQNVARTDDPTRRKLRGNKGDSVRVQVAVRRDRGHRLHR